MSDTLRLNMPLLDAAQAQKHVTINEALARADVFAAARAERRDLAAPPAIVDGEAYIVAPGATDAWAGQDGRIALAMNGGWEFADPWEGLALWIGNEACRAVYTGGSWVGGHSAGAPGGASTSLDIVEIDHVITPGPVSSTVALIPDKAIVYGVTARVILPISGATGFSVGVAGSPDRYGTGYGTSMNAFVHGVSGQPQAYYGGTALDLTAEGGNFVAGALRIAVHIVELSPPAAV